MTDFEPSDRDELVAAYLDDEASATERARVEADPELVARVAAMRRVAELVAEPVIPPSLELRNQHIAAALSVSATATNVISLAPRQRWSPQFAKVLSAAAVIMLILFAGSLVLLSGSGDSEDTATSVPADDAATDASSDNATAADEPAEEAASEAPALADTQASDGGADATELEAPVASGDDDAADDEDAAIEEEAPAEEEAQEAVADGELFQEFARDAFVFAAGDQPGIAALADAVSDILSQDENGRRAASDLLAETQFQCVEVLSALTEGNEVLLVGTATIAGEGFEYVVVVEVLVEPQGRRLIVVDVEACGIFDDLAVGS